MPWLEHTSAATLARMVRRGDTPCAQNPELFYPPLGDAAGVARARSLCDRCADRVDCLAEVLSSPDVDAGIWGALTAAERRAERRRVRQPVTAD